MTPAARISAAIDLMDRILGGELADRALAGWGRKNRYAGSKDRAAIGDLVYETLRRRRSLAALGGGETGRALLIGYLRETGQDLESIFGAGTYAPPPLSEAERLAGRIPLPDTSESLDMPEWLWPHLLASLGDDVRAIAGKMQSRAPVYLRANLNKVSRDVAVDALAHEGIIAQPHPLSPSALEVVAGARKVRNSEAYHGGLVELQDAASQAVSDMVPLEPGQAMLDFCAGGGGKTLAVGGRVAGVFFAHDVDQGRMKDVPARAERAGVPVNLIALAQAVQSDGFHTVVVDAPCSGSGSWRRDPQGKWLLNLGLLGETVQLQTSILAQAAKLVRPKGHLVYATCSLLKQENSDQVRDFLEAETGFSLCSERQLTPIEGGDGFYCAVLRKCG